MNVPKIYIIVWLNWLSYRYLAAWEMVKSSHWYYTFLDNVGMVSLYEV
jgi:hypothetical protein